MDYYSVLISAIAGGFAGAVIGLSKKSNGKKSKIGVVFGISLFFILGGIGKSPQARSLIMPYFDNNYGIKEKITIEMNNITGDPRVKESLSRLSTEKEAFQYSQRMVRKGIAKFDLKNLLLWNSLRLKMATQSEEICSGFWTGKIVQNDMYRVLDSLSESDFKSYMMMTKLAIQTELESDKSIVQNPSDFQKGFLAIRNLEGHEDSTKMAILLGKGANISNQDSCYMIKKIMKGVSKVDNTTAEGLLRYWASL